MASQSAPKILYIDDDRNELFLTKLVLEKAGYCVFTVRNAEQALKVLSEEAISLVLSDHLLCGATGAEIAGKLRSYTQALWSFCSPGWLSHQ